MSAFKKRILIGIVGVLAIGIAIAVSVTVHNRKEKSIDVSYRQNALYLSPHYSLSIDAFSSEVDSVTHNVDADSFEILYNGNSPILKSITVKEPQYTREELKNKLFVMENMYLDISSFATAVCYSVKSAEGEDTGYRLFVMDDAVWIGHWAYYGAQKDAWWCEYIYRIADMDTANHIKDIL